MGLKARDNNDEQKLFSEDNPIDCLILEQRPSVNLDGGDKDPPMS